MRPDYSASHTKESLCWRILHRDLSVCCSHWLMCSCSLALDPWDVWQIVHLNARFSEQSQIVYLMVYKMFTWCPHIQHLNSNVYYYIKYFERMPYPCDQYVILQHPDPIPTMPVASTTYGRLSSCTTNLCVHPNPINRNTSANLLYAASYIVCVQCPKKT